MSYTEIITDENNVLGFGDGAVVEAELYCTIDPGEPPCRSSLSWDGWPGVEPSVSLDAISILSVRLPDGDEVEITAEQEDAAVRFVDEETRRRWGRIEESILHNKPWSREDMEDARNDR